MKRIWSTGSNNVASTRGLFMEDIIWSSDDRYMSMLQSASTSNAIDFGVCFLVHMDSAVMLHHQLEV